MMLNMAGQPLTTSHIGSGSHMMTTAAGGGVQNHGITTADEMDCWDHDGSDDSYKMYGNQRDYVDSAGLPRAFEVSVQRNQHTTDSMNV